MPEINRVGKILQALPAENGNGKHPPGTKDYTRVYQKFQVVFTSSSGEEAIAEECPFCSGEKFYVNRSTGQYQCKHGKCHEQGNVTTFLTWVHDKYLDETTDDDYRELSKKRGIHSQTLKAYGLAFDRVNQQWLIPFKNAKGNVVNMELYHWRKESKPTKCALPLLPRCLFGFEQLHDPKKARKPVFLFEGVFDLIAFGGRIGSEQRYNYALVASPGGFQKEWAPHFKGRKVRAVYDNDQAGRKHLDTIKKCLILDKPRVADELMVLQWPDGYADGYDMNEWVRDPQHKDEKVISWVVKHSTKVGPAAKLDWQHGWEHTSDASEQIDWPWPDHLRCGTYVSFSGKGGTLKSTLIRELVARYTRGMRMPTCDQDGMPPGHAIYITAEDSPETVRESLRYFDDDGHEVKADPRYYSVLKATLKDGDALNILDNLDELREMIRKCGTRLVIIDGQNSVVGAPNIQTDMLARTNVTNKLHQFAQKENICLIGIRNEDKEGRALGPQSMGDMGRVIMRAVEYEKDKQGNRYFRLVFDKVSDRARSTHPPISYSVEDLGGSSRRILWGKTPPDPDPESVQLSPEQAQSARGLFTPKKSPAPGKENPL